jgi:hypothetical protein
VSGFYRYGAPGKDTYVHLNTGRKASGAPCVMDRFREDNQRLGSTCARMSIALCDAPGCDRPICELHRTKHQTKANTDFCLFHKEMANQ